jgi:hypothetical protein
MKNTYKTSKVTVGTVRKSPRRVASEGTDPTSSRAVCRHLGPIGMYPATAPLLTSWRAWPLSAAMRRRLTHPVVRCHSLDQRDDFAPDRRTPGAPRLVGPEAAESTTMPADGHGGLHDDGASETVVHARRRSEPSTKLLSLFVLRRGSLHDGSEIYNVTPRWHPLPCGCGGEEVDRRGKFPVKVSPSRV